MLFRFFLVFVFAHQAFGQINPPTNINSPYDEQGPVLHPNGKEFYFTRANHPQNHGGIRDKGDIWRAVLNEDGTWSSPQRVTDPINNSGWNAVLGFSAGGNLMYLHHHYDKQGGVANTQGISVSQKVGDAWSEPMPVNIPYFQNKSSHQSGSISERGDIIVLALEGFGSLGAEDLYACFLGENGAWSDLRHLGTQINTSLQEFSPFLAPDNRTLYFSSNGRKGEGSADIFVTKRLDDTWKNWSTPKNLGTEVNTIGREMYYRYASGKDLAYFTSTLNSDGYGDIRFVKPIDPPELEIIQDSIPLIALNPPDTVQTGTKESLMVRILGKVLDAENQQPLLANISIKEALDSEMVQTNPLDGRFALIVDGDSIYSLLITAPGYLGVEESINLFGKTSGNFELELELRRAGLGSVINLESVLFEQSTANLLETSYRQLDQVARLLHENPKMEIFLSGHTDNRGSYKKNLELSQQRVDAVIEYFKSKGINKDRLSGKGFAGDQPIASNQSEETRKLNRRVEFKVVKE